MERLFSHAKFYDLVELVYAAGCDPAEWRHFAKTVQQSVPGSAFTILLDIEGTHLDFHSALAGLPDEFIASYMREYGRINPFNPIFSKVPTKRTYVRSEIGPPGWLDKDVFVNEWLLPAGDFTHGAGNVLVRDERHQLRVTMDLPRRSAELEPAVHCLFEALKPHLLRAFSVNEKLAATASHSHALDTMVAQIEGSVAVLDSHERVIMLNEGAQALCQRGDVLRCDRSGHLSFSQTAAQSAYKAAVASVISPLLSPDPHAFSVQGHDFAGVAVVLPLRHHTINIAAAAGRRPKAMVVIRDVGHRAAVPKDLFKQAFGFTNAEAELAMRLVAGLTVKEVAADLDVTQATARNQLASVMRKVGVSRQSDLITTLLTLVPTLQIDP